LPSKPVLENHLIDYLPAKDASPSKKMLAVVIKFLVAHHPAATIGPHDLFLLKGTLLWFYSWPKPEPLPKIRSWEVPTHSSLGLCELSLSLWAS
jgi:hypothetical protein